jgi:hypothetical protein
MGWNGLSGSTGFVILPWAPRELMIMSSLNPAFVSRKKTLKII